MKNLNIQNKEININSKKENIESLIYEVRGKQVMLDSDLALLYETETKRINEAVNRNKDKFPERFSWVLNEEETKLFRSQIATKKIETRGGRYKNPRVFTEQGIAMLSTILKTPVAVKTSISIMDAFIAMRKYISSNLIEQKYINNLVLEDHNRINILEKSFEKLDEKRKVTEIYFNGQIYDAYSKIQEIFEKAKKEIIIIDNYADYALLNIIKKLKVNITIITKKDNLLTNEDILKYNKQYHNLRVVYDNSFHDRYFILDKDQIYHCGASINRIGYKTFSITLISDKEICNMLIAKINAII